MRRDYQHEADIIERQRARCPRACAMWDRLFDAMSRLGGNHRLEVALVGLGACIDKGREIGDQEATFYEALLTEAA